MSDRIFQTDYSFIYAKPINVYFECTVACDLACKHCRAEAIHERSPNEIDTREAKELVRQVKALGSRLILSGGDPLKREDLAEILSYARELIVPVGVTPTTSPLATYKALSALKDLGIFALGVSLDGATCETQDGFRGVEGTFECSIRVLSYARELGIPVQVNTTCTEETIGEIEGIYSLLAKEFSPPVRRWSVFHLVPMGRGRGLRLPSRERLRQMHAFLYEKSCTSPFHITTTEAPYYKVYVILKELEKGKSWVEMIANGRRMGLGVRDGNGVIFVSHKGDVYPSGFLPLRLADFRDKSLGEVYRSDDTLLSLRNPGLLGGKCGRCFFKFICGGSRARAYSVTGDFMGEDPLCSLTLQEILPTM
jgi:radical SAM protein with 4Fe4S-binding SPASM domain